MAKKINLVVNSCGECPYIEELGWYNYKCNHPNEIGDVLSNKTICLHCPLEDVEENKCIDCEHCSELSAWCKSNETLKYHIENPHKETCNSFIKKQNFK
jgi:hypothetical protein